MIRTSIFFLFTTSLLWGQINTGNEAAPGFEKRIRDAVWSIRIVDTHEHLLPEKERIRRGPKIDFTYLFSHYANEDLVSASNAAGLVKRIFDTELNLDDRWSIFQPYYECIRNTGYAQVAQIAANDLFDIDNLDSLSYKSLSQKLSDSSHAGWYETVLKEKAGIDMVIRDGWSPLFNKPYYQHVERFDSFIFVSSITEIEQHIDNANLTEYTLDNYLKALRTEFARGLERKMIGVKTGLAYQRTLKYENIDKTRANKIFQLMHKGQKPDIDDLQAFQDYMMHCVLDLADEFNLPVQIHTGLQAGNGNTITNSNPVLLTNLFMEYPDVDFILFHGSYPYGGECSTLAKNFANVFIDMCWAPIISPSFSIRYLHEWLETVPANKIMAFGGDYQIVEAIYAHSVIARKIVAQVLTEKVASGYLSESHAVEIAQRLLRDNALQVFQLGKSRDPDDLQVLQQPGPLHDWWTVHKSQQGLIKTYQVIGPFGYGNGLQQIHPPEKEFNPNARYTGLTGEIGWQKVQTDESGYLNFISLFNQDGNGSTGFRGIAFAMFEIDSPDSRPATFTIGSNDGARVWLNNELVYDKPGGRTAVADQDFLRGTLKKGKNLILIKVENIGAAWGLYFRIVDLTRELAIQ